MLIYVTKGGDTLYSVAAQYDLEPTLLAGMNGLPDDAQLVVGQALLVREPGRVHRVAAGDTLSAIARRYGTDVSTLCRNNYRLGGRDALREGELLVVSYDDEAPLGTIGVNGYAYPYIEPPLLDAAAPYLSYLTPFTHGIGRDGALLPPDDAALLDAAGRYGVAPLLHLSTLTEEGHFSNERASLLLGSPALQERLIDAVERLAREKGYYGVDVDFEFVPAAERTRYAAFVRRLRERMNALGCPVLVALAPKTRADQPGLLYEAHDYALLGEAANAVLLMTYEWGYTYGPPMAVAPLPQVRAVLDYAVSAIEPKKIFLGVPLYGYDWALPFVRGTTRAESLSPSRAVELALRYGTEIMYDEQAQAPYFYYTDRAARAHVVWFEDARSIDAKLRLVAEYGLQGVGCWNLMRAMPQCWTLLNALYRIETIP